MKHGHNIPLIIGVNTTLKLLYTCIIGMIPLYESDILNYSIPGKCMLCARFGSTIFKYAFKSSPNKVGVGGV